MQHPIKVLAVSFCICLSACTSASKEENDEARISISENVKKSPIQHKTDFADSSSSKTKAEQQSQCVSNIKNLVYWSRKNLDKLVDNPFSKYSNDSSYVHINLDKTSQYLNFLKSSGFFSQRFLKTWDDTYRKIDTRLEHEKTLEPAVPELSYNIVFLSQEIDLSLSDYKSFDYSQKGDLIYINNNGRVLIFKLNNSCKIDTIFSK